MSVSKINDALVTSMVYLQVTQDENNQKNAALKAAIASGLAAGLKGASSAAPAAPVNDPAPTPQQATADAQALAWIAEYMMSGSTNDGGGGNLMTDISNNMANCSPGMAGMLQLFLQKYNSDNGQGIDPIPDLVNDLITWMTNPPNSTVNLLAFLQADFGNGQTPTAQDSFNLGLFGMLSDVIFAEANIAPPFDQIWNIMGTNPPGRSLSNTFPAFALSYLYTITGGDQTKFNQQYNFFFGPNGCVSSSIQSWYSQCPEGAAMMNQIQSDYAYLSQNGYDISKILPPGVTLDQLNNDMALLWQMIIPTSFSPPIPPTPPSSSSN
jgi:hypothetical protein